MKKIILPAIVFAIAAIFLGPGLFIKVKINCLSQYGSCPPQITDMTDSLNGKGLFYAKRRLAGILKTNYLVSAYTVQFKLPDILKVNLIVKKPVFALKDNGSGTIALVEKEGVVLAASSSTDLPTIIVNEAVPPVGGSVSSANLFALTLMRGVFKMYQTTTGNIEGDTLLVDLPGSIRVIFPLAGSDADMLLGSVRLIYSNIRDDGNAKPYSQIDLRYQNPVLR